MLSLAVVLGLAAAPASADLDCDWRMYGHDPGHSFAQPFACSSITPQNVSTLVPKWFVDTASPVTASPAVADGTVYVAENAGPFYALDAETGAERWRFQPDDGNDYYIGIVSSAAAVEIDGVDVVLFAAGATLYMLDAADGALLAQLCVDPRAPSEPRCAGSNRDIQIETSPNVVWVDGEPWVVIGMDVHNGRDIGRTGVIAIRIDEHDDRWSLTPLWKFDPENRQTYTGSDMLWTGAGTGDGCGGVWSSPSVDVDDDWVFFGTASCSVGSLQDGPLSGESLYGIELRTGEFGWQYNPRVDREESTRLDDDFGASTNLLPGGRVGGGSKDGWYYGLERDRDDGSELGEDEWATRAGQAGHAGEDFAIGGMIGTAAVGEWLDEPAVFATTAISTPLNNTNDGFDETLLSDPGRMFSIHAISAIDGRLLWRSPLSRQSYGAPTYARGLVFVPSTVGFGIYVFSADSGLLLKVIPLNGAPSSAPAIVGDSIYAGAGTNAQGLPIDELSGIWAFRTLV